MTAVTQGNPRQVIHAFLSPFRADGSVKETGGLSFYESLSKKWICKQIRRNGGYVFGNEIVRSYAKSLVIDSDEDDETISRESLQRETRQMEDMVQDTLFLALRALDKKYAKLPECMPVSEIKVILIHAVIQAARQVGNGRQACQTERTAYRVTHETGLDASDTASPVVSDEEDQDKIQENFEKWCDSYGLSEREVIVAQLVAEGFSQSDAARILGRSRKTVSLQIKSGKPKLRKAWVDRGVKRLEIALNSAF